MKIPINGAGAQPASTSDAAEVEKKRIINPELWQACAGPLVNMPVAGTHVIYFPQGHCEQVAASMKKDADAQIPSYPNLPSQLLCLLHNVTLLADRDTDEVYALMTLQPVPSFDKDALLRSDLSMKANKPQTEFFCKTLTASDTSTHGGFSVPRHAAEKTFPPLDFTMQPPAQELVARDLHDNVWTFRHIYRGQPKRHLLTTGWSSFVGGKRLFAGDSVLFIRDEKQQLLLGIRRANRQTTNLSSSVLSSDSMHIGILAAAAHAASNNSPFTVFYNPRASPSEFVIPLAKYYKAACSKQISLGMRFRMTFETEESGTRRYMGTITGISDLDSVRWKNSQWRNLQVGWDDSTAGERRNRVSIWEIEPVTAPFFICPTTPFFCSKCLRQLGMQDDDLCDPNNLFRQPMPWLGDNFGTKETQAMLGLSLVQWMNMQPNPSLTNSDFLGTDLSCQLGFPAPQLNNLQFNAPRPAQPIQQLDQLQMPSASTLNPLASIIQTQQQFTDTMQPPRQNIMNQTLPTSQVQAQLLQSRSPIQAQNILQQQQSILNNQVQRSLPQNLPQQQENPSHVQHQDLTPFKSLDHASQQFHVPENQIQLQLIQKLHPQQQSLLAQQSAIPQPFHLTEQQDQQKLPLDASQKYSWSMIDPLLEASQSKLTMLPQHVILPQMGRKNSQTNLQFAHPKLQQHQQSGTQSELHMFVGNTSNPMNSHLSTGDSSTFKRPSTGGGQSGITDEFPSCSTSPSTKSCPSAVQSMMNGRTYRSTLTGDEIAQSSATLLSSGVKNVSSDGNLVKDFQQKLNIKTSLNISKNQGSGDFSNNLSSEGEMLSNYENPKETHLELSLSMVSPSFGVSDMAFNSIDSRINDSSLMNGGVWAPPPQIPRMRTYTKVYKHGAVGRSIDIARYMGYEDLKQDLARRFGIEGQLEDGQRIGWKLVYVDHENDVLMVGDDPWEEFVNCVRCIKILSPQEVQQISLDEDFGNPSKLRF